MILLASPTGPDSTHGNGVTARRWAAILRDLGHEVALTQDWPGAPAGRYDALVALHAVKSAAVVRRFAAEHPGAPVVLALTGTDLYPGPRTPGMDPAVLALAARFVVLQPAALDQLGAADRPRARVIVQSAPPPPPRATWASHGSPDEARDAQGPWGAEGFPVVFLAHLRAVKDPLLPAAAVRLLAPSSTVTVTHAGAAMDEELAAAARAETADNPRYTWLGPRPREEALALLARSRLLLLTSRSEGGANVVSEALAAGVPVLSAAIPGSVGLLGRDYPGYFPVGEARALAAALDAAEHDRGGFYRELRARCAELRHLVDPARERQSWAALLSELGLRVNAAPPATEELIPMRRTALVLAAALSTVLAACGAGPGGTPGGQGGGPGGAGGSGGTLSVSAIPDQDPQVLQRLYGSVSEYLAGKLGVQVRYVPVTDYTAAVAAFRRGDLQLVFFGGLTGVQARLQVPGARPIAQRDIDESFHSVFIANTGARLGPVSEVAGLSALAGHSFTLGSQTSTSGSLMPQFFLSQAGVKLDSFSGQVGYSGSHDATIKLVEAGTYQAGALNAAVWDDRVKNAKVDTAKVVEVFRTPAYHDYHWLIRPDADQQFGDGFTGKVTDALLGLDGSDDQEKQILQLFQAGRFVPTTEGNYKQIEDIGREIGLVN